MINTEALFRIGDAAEEAGDYERALQSFEKGAALGDVSCLTRLAYLFDVGIGVAIDKAFAMRCYQRAWRRGRCYIAANNIASFTGKAENCGRCFDGLRALLNKVTMMRCWNWRNVTSVALG